MKLNAKAGVTLAATAAALLVSGTLVSAAVAGESPARPVANTEALKSFFTAHSLL